jgi:membrane-associated phospholipid phosphatase
VCTARRFSDELAMKCTRCGHANPDRARFRLDCGTPVTQACASCGTELPSGAKFCLESGTAVADGAPPTRTTVGPEGGPLWYTPKHLPDKILQSRSVLEGKRNQVALFADVKGSMELAEVSIKTQSGSNRGDVPRAHWLAWGTVPTIAVAVLALGVEWLGNGHFDRTVYWVSQREYFISLNLALSMWPPRVWSNLTLLGEAWVLLFMLSPLLIWRPRAWAAILGSVPVAAMISAIGKHLAGIPRPRAVLDEYHFVVIGNSLSAHNSFPSGHAIVAFTAAIAVLATLVPQPRGWSQWSLLATGILVAATISLSRVAVGAHWPLDLLAGAAVGWVAGLCGATLAARYQRWWRFALDTPGRYVLGTVIALASLEFMQRALSDPFDGPVLWISALSAMTTSLWLMSGLLARFRS